LAGIAYDNVEMVADRHRFAAYYKQALATSFLEM